MSKSHLEFDFNKSKDTIISVLCWRCVIKTNHLVMYSVDRTASGGIEDEFWWTDIYQIVKCNGCDNLSFRHASYFSEDLIIDNEGNWIPNIKITLYPSRIAERKPPNGMEFVPFQIRSIYEETILAIGASQPILAGIGIRALIESVCNEKKAAGVNLAAKIDDLVRLNVLTKEGADVLHHLRILGNVAAHEVKPLSENKLSIALDIVDNLLKSVYIIPNRAKTLKG